MNKEELTNRIQEGLFDLAPDVFDDILEAIEQPVENNVYSIEEKKKTAPIYNTMGFQMLRRVAVFILIIGLGFLGIQGTQENYIVTIDVNPSIRMEVNRQYEVRKMTGMNEDGEKLIEELEWEKNSSVQQTLKIITSALVSEGYLQKDGGILVTVYNIRNIQNSDELKAIVNRELKNDAVEYGCDEVEVMFQMVETKKEQTGKAILQERMVEECDLENDEVDQMNIRDMLDYVEKEKPQRGILEKIPVSVEPQTQELTTEDGRMNTIEQTVYKDYNSDNVKKENAESKTQYPNGNLNNNNASTDTKKQSGQSKKNTETGLDKKVTTEQNKNGKNTGTQSSNDRNWNSKNERTTSVQDSNHRRTEEKRTSELNPNQNRQEERTTSVRNSNQNGQEEKTTSIRNPNPDRQEERTTSVRNPNQNRHEENRTSEQNSNDEEPEVTATTESRREDDDRNGGETGNNRGDRTNRDDWEDDDWDSNNHEERTTREENDDDENDDDDEEDDWGRTGRGESSTREGWEDDDWDSNNREERTIRNDSSTEQNNRGRSNHEAGMTEEED